MGAIDGCHVRIKSPGEPHGQNYFNRKSFHSIQLQAVCDHAGRFIDVFVGYPGSVHDTQVLRHSPRFQSVAYPLPDTFLLGDGGYPCLLRPISLITPYKNPLRGVAQQRNTDRSLKHRIHSTHPTHYTHTNDQGGWSHPKPGPFRGFFLHGSFSSSLLPLCLL
ncbi:putative nuclease HARBI1 [Hypomesus transpacificus]|uniref:putative nuclease HARBI1 n=1 Tax=Hypomesus transpacificus TaxID=137520 RepID=UPI001F0801E4|nr:putative nuclease HARBI1 [Hypomesus transpacificus]